MGIKRYAKRAGRSSGELSAMEYAIRREEFEEAKKLKQLNAMRELEERKAAKRQQQENYEKERAWKEKQAAIDSENERMALNLRAKEIEQRGRVADRRNEISAMRNARSSSGSSSGNRSAIKEAGVTTQNAPQTESVSFQPANELEAQAVRLTRNELSSKVAEIENKFSDSYINNAEIKRGVTEGGKTYPSYEEEVYNRVYNNEMRGVPAVGEKPAMRYDDVSTTYERTEGGITTTGSTTKNVPNVESELALKDYYKRKESYDKAEAAARQKAFDAVKAYRQSQKDSALKELSDMASSIYSEKKNQLEDEISPVAKNRAIDAIGDWNTYNAKSKVKHDSLYHQLWKESGYSEKPEVVADIEKKWKETTYKNLLEAEVQKQLRFLRNNYKWER